MIEIIDTHVLRKSVSQNRSKEVQNRRLYFLIFYLKHTVYVIIQRKPSLRPRYPNLTKVLLS